MAEIQYDPACVDCRRDNGRDLAGTTWQCNGHVRAERDWLRAKLANFWADAEQDIFALTKERNAALLLAEQRGAAYDMTWRTVESLRERLDSCEAERDEWKSHFDDERAKRVPPPADAATEAVLERAREEQRKDHGVICALATQRDDLASALRQCASAAGNRDAAQACRLVIEIARAALSTPAPAPSAPEVKPCVNCDGDQTCERCGGSGGGPDLPHRCISCDGTGRCYLCAPAPSAKEGE